MVIVGGSHPVWTCCPVSVSSYTPSVCATPPPPFHLSHYPSHTPYARPLSSTQRTLIQQSAYVLCASGTDSVQTRRRVISLCFVQIAASDDGNLIPSVHWRRRRRRRRRRALHPPLQRHACMVPLIQTHVCRLVPNIPNC